MKKIILLSLLSFTSFSANALMNCGLVPVKEIVIETDRENGSVWANTMHINISGSACSGISHTYLRNDHPAYNSTLSLLLSAHARGQDIKVIVKSTEGLSSYSREIDYIILP